MSNTLAIGAVTATLRSLLETEIAREGGGLRVTTLPPDKAQTFNAGEGGGWINLFLYHTQINPAWRNTNSPRQLKPNESGFPPLGLDLFYLVTAYEKADGDSSVLAHRMLGRAMLVLHDHPLLGADEIRAVVPDNDLADQIERVRITPHAMSLEDLSKLWMIFQTGYRISAAYQVSLILIDSRRSARTPLPVLTRGEDDSGPQAQADLVPPFPALLTAALPDDQRSTRVGDEVSLGGVHLDGDNVAVRFKTIRLTNPQVEPASGTEKEVKVTVPDLPAGSYTIAVRVSKAGQLDRFTNEYPLQIAPRITNITPSTAPAGNLTLTIKCSPDVLPEQRVTLLFRDREVAAQAHTASTDTLDFALTDLDPGEYFVRLRVDGVDSLLVIKAGAPPKLQFDPNQKVTIT
jgi:Pvc16 N-terminal domain